MKTFNRILILLVILLLLFNCILLVRALSKQNKQIKHDYLVIYEAQTNGQPFWSTRQRFLAGSKFTLTDEHWFRTNEMAGNTNMAVVILNIIKLDD